MVAAFFDMDETVLAINSGTSWMQYLRRRGEISRWELVRALGWALQYKLSVLDVETLSARLVSELAGQPEADMLAKAGHWFRTEVAHTVRRRALQVMDSHRRAGHPVVLLTSATQFVAEPLARALDFDDVLCSRLEVGAARRFTGRIDGPLCFGTGKVVVAERWARAHGADLAQSTFYTDSYNDRPMLERVGHPVVVNPDPRLRRLARRKRWPVHDWNR